MFIQFYMWSIVSGFTDLEKKSRKVPSMQAVSACAENKCWEIKQENVLTRTRGTVKQLEQFFNLGDFMGFGLKCV